MRRSRTGGGAAPLQMRAAAEQPDVFLASKIELRPIGDIRRYEREVRIHNANQIQKLIDIVRQAGFLVPIIIDGDGVIVAGHARYECAMTLGLKRVPVICVDHLSKAQIKAFRLGDNKVFELGEINLPVVGIELKELMEIEPLKPGALDLTCYETAEMDVAIAAIDGAGASSDPADEPFEPVEGPAVTRPGDVLILGRLGHRLVCGSALEEETYQRLLGSVRARTVASDPPFNVKISGHVSGLGKVRHREFAMASGEMSEPDFVVFLTRYLELTRSYSVPGSLHYSFMDAAHNLALLVAARKAGLIFKITCVWAKTNAGLGSFYRNQVEYCHVFKNGGADVQHVNNIQLGRFGRSRSTLWTYAGCNTFRKGRMDDLNAHPSVKPIALVMDLIKDSSRHGEAILDAFCGSGTTILAAERTGRVGYGIELDPLYCDLIARRFQALTGQAVVYEATGQTFDEAQAARPSSAKILQLPAPSAHRGGEGGNDA